MQLNNKTLLDKLDRSKKYKLSCGHNNAVIPNVWPFDLMVCLVCGYKTSTVLIDE